MYANKPASGFFVQQSPLGASHHMHQSQQQQQHHHNHHDIRDPNALYSIGVNQAAPSSAAASIVSDLSGSIGYETLDHHHYNGIGMQHHQPLHQQQHYHHLHSSTTANASPSFITSTHAWQNMSSAPLSASSLSSSSSSSSSSSTSDFYPSSSSGSSTSSCGYATSIHHNHQLQQHTNHHHHQQQQQQQQQHNQSHNYNSTSLASAPIQSGLTHAGSSNSPYTSAYFGYHASTSPSALATTMSDMFCMGGGISTGISTSSVSSSGLAGVLASGDGGLGFNAASHMVECTKKVASKAKARKSTTAKTIKKEKKRPMNSEDEHDEDDDDDEEDDDDDEEGNHNAVAVVVANRCQVGVESGDESNHGLNEAKRRAATALDEDTNTHEPYDDDDDDDDDEDDDDSSSVGYQSGNRGGDMAHMPQPHQHYAAQQPIRHHSSNRANRKHQQQQQQQQGTSDANIIIYFRVKELASSGSANSDGASVIRFTLAQLKCIIEALLHISNYKKIRSILTSLGIDAQKGLVATATATAAVTGGEMEANCGGATASGPLNDEQTSRFLARHDSILKCRAALLLDEAKFRELYSLLESHSFDVRLIYLF